MKKVVLLMVATIFIFNADPAKANTFVSFDAPFGNQTFANGINNSGNVVGYSSNNPDNSSVNGFLFDGSSFTTISFPGLRTTTNGINDINQVVGEYGTSSSGDGNGYIWQNGTFTTINVPGFPATTFHDINNNGKIVGYTRSANGFAAGGFLWESGAFTFLNNPNLIPWGINDLGHMVGEDGNGGGFFSDGITTTEITIPNADYTSPVSINNNGQIAGGFVINGIRKGFVLDGDNLKTFALPGVYNTSFSGINDSGMLTGSFRISPFDPEMHSFIASIDSFNFDIASFDANAVPEPATMLLFSTGLLGAFTGRRRRF